MSPNTAPGEENTGGAQRSSQVEETVCPESSQVRVKEEGCRERGLKICRRWNTNENVSAGVLKKLPEARKQTTQKD